MPRLTDVYDIISFVQYVALPFPRDNLKAQLMLKLGTTFRRNETCCCFSYFHPKQSLHCVANSTSLVVGFK